MSYQGKLESVSKAITGGGYLVTFRLDGYPQGMEGKTLEVDVKEFRPHRSKDANALLWACLNDIAKVLKTDTWGIYLTMLKRYGKAVCIVVKPEAVDAVRRQWRESEILGDYEVNGQKGVQMLCYYGSSTFDSSEMSRLLDGVISEMEELNIPRPTSAEMRRTIEEMEKRNGCLEHEKICNTTETASTKV